MSDPNVALKRLREAMAEYWELMGGDDASLLEGGPAQDMAEAAGDLDDWLSAPKRGYLPDDWQHGPKGWGFTQLDATTWLIMLNGKVLHTLRYNSRGAGAYETYTTEFGVERYTDPVAAFRVVMNRYEGKG